MFSVDLPTLRLRDVLAKPNPKVRELLKGANVNFTCNARGALYQLLRAFPSEKGRVVLVPAFHCVTAVEPVIRAGYRALFYKINEDLSIAYEDLYAKLSSDIAAVVVINYFGFPTDIDGILALREKYDYYVVEDWAHSFLKGDPERLTGEKGDMAIFSFRKLVPSYVGGGLRINSNEFTGRFSLDRLGGMRSMVILKRLAEEIIENFGDGMLRSAFRYIENKRVDHKQKQVFSVAGPDSRLNGASVSHDDIATAELPWFSKAILHLSDFGSIISTRRRNYRLLDEHLAENTYIHKIFPPLPDYVCPWAYPVWITDRAKYDHQLRKLGVPVFTFGEVLHPLVYKSDSSLIAAVKALSTNLLMIPVHQNLDHDAMVSFCRTINQFFRALEMKY
jgi:dTDP-4-amino-4,6-dideoxygalactose transaminase